MQIILSVNKNIKNKKFKMKESHIEFDKIYGNLILFPERC